MPKCKPQGIEAKHKELYIVKFKERVQFSYGAPITIKVAKTAAVTMFSKKYGNVYAHANDTCIHFTHIKV